MEVFNPTLTEGHAIEFQTKYRIVWHSSPKTLASLNRGPHYDTTFRTVKIKFQI